MKSAKDKPASSAMDCQTRRSSGNNKICTQAVRFFRGFVPGSGSFFGIGVVLFRFRRVPKGGHPLDNPISDSYWVSWLKRKIKKNKMKYSRSFAFILYFWIHEDVRAFSLPKITHYSSREEDPGFHLGEELQNEKGRK